MLKFLFIRQSRKQIYFFLFINNKMASLSMIVHDKHLTGKLIARKEESFDLCRFGFAQICSSKIQHSYSHNSNLFSLAHLYYLFPFVAYFLHVTAALNLQTMK